LAQPFVLDAVNCLLGKAPVQGTVPDSNEIYTTIPINNSKLMTLIMRSLSNDLDFTQPRIIKISTDNIETTGPT
jgi:hypothetical protein